MVSLQHLTVGTTDESMEVLHSKQSAECPPPPPTPGGETTPGPGSCVDKAETADNFCQVGGGGGGQGRQPHPDTLPLVNTTTQTNHTLPEYTSSFNISNSSRENITNNSVQVLTKYPVSFSLFFCIFKMNFFQNILYHDRVSLA